MPGKIVTGAPCPQERTAGIDWFRFKAEGVASARQAQEAALVIQREDVERGSPVKPWKWQGYEGKMTRRIRWGRRGTNLYWETSGEWADSTWIRMPRSGGRSTRIDLHSTMRFSQPLPGFGSLCLPPEATTHPHRLPSGTPVGLSRGPDGMWLGTVGRRTAPEYFRLYDKGVETRNCMAGFLWRLELEAKHGASEALCETQAGSLKDPKWCGRYVTSRWLQSGLLWPINEDEQSLDAIAPARRPSSPSGALLRWLDHSVKPVVTRLARTVPTEVLLEALGLNGLAEPRRWDSDAS
jgi:hypothetical protein